MKNIKDKIRRFNIHLTRVPERDKRKHKTNAASEKIKLGIFQNRFKKTPNHSSRSPVKPKPDEKIKIKNSYFDTL